MQCGQLRYQMLSLREAGPYRPRPAASRAYTSRALPRILVEYLGVGAVFVQVGLVCLIARQAGVLTPTFRWLLAMAAVAFVIHHAIPARHRMTAFAAFCGMALVFVLGHSSTPWSAGLALGRTGVLLAVAALLVVICLLPINYWARAGLLAAAGVAVALFRTNAVGPETLLVVWPVLAGLVMFRIIVYLYECSAMKARPAPAETAAYFLLFPNICAGLFPVIGFKAFQRSHYARNELAIYQRGAQLIVRGLTHLLAYRIVQQLFTLRPEDVASGRDLIQFVLANSFLYLKVSGQFHLFIGFLALFGFDLPDANHRYFLASSFTDYWRRVNIYWKDFILKVFYYPAYFRLRSLGEGWALAMATLWAFAVTWVLHLYQTFWLKGEFSVTWPDILFWSILGVLVLLNSLWEMRRGRLRKLASGSYSVRTALGLALRTAATFACISVLWSLWSTPTLSLWLSLWRFADTSTLVWGLAALVAVMAATIAFEVLPSTRHDRPAASGFLPFARPAVSALATLVLLFAVTSPRVQAHFDRNALVPWFDALNTGDSMLDETVARNGYYENLMKADQANARVWEMLNQEPLPYQYSGPDPVRHVQDFRFRELIPNVRMQAYDTYFEVNRWGMRDQEYGLQPPDDTVRIALLGSSHTMGWGVPKDQTFEAILERRLNAGLAMKGESVDVEILNFSMYGLSPLGQLETIDRKVARFKPDVIMLVTHVTDKFFLSRDLVKGLRAGLRRNAFLDDVVRKARLSRRTHEVIARQRLKPYELTLLQWSYDRIVERIRAARAVPAAVFLPLPAELPLSPATSRTMTTAITRAGFRLIDLSHVFDGQTRHSLILNEGWHHMNARAHRMVAEALYQRLAGASTSSLIHQARRAAPRRKAEAAVTTGGN